MTGSPATSGSARPPTPVGLCLATPDGLPVVGFHPGFEAGRVVVTFNASAVSSLSLLPHQQGGPGEGAVPDSRGSDTRSSSDREERIPAERKDRQRAAVPYQDTQTVSVAGSDNSGDATPIASALGDGFQLTPLLAKAATDLLTEGCTHLNLPISEALSLSRSGWVPGSPQTTGGAVAAALAAEGVDSWGELVRLQDGCVHRYRSPEEVEREADEREDLRRAKAG